MQKHIYILLLSLMNGDEIPDKFSRVCLTGIFTRVSILHTVDGQTGKDIYYDSDSNDSKQNK